MTFNSLPKTLLFLTSFIFVFSCDFKEPKKFSQIKGEAQGTTFSIVYEDLNDRDFSARIDSIFIEIDKSMSLWDSTSTITSLNQSKEGIKVDSHFVAVFNKSKEIHEKTSGKFDITLGPLIKTWKFIRSNDLSLPSEEEISIMKRNVGMHNFQLKGKTLRKTNPLAEIDMNSIAQGYTVDVIAEMLIKEGIKNFLVEVGGELRTVGKNQQNESWNVGVEKPDFNKTLNKNKIELVLGLSGGALATSGSYRKFIEVDGKKYSHTIDPLSGKPVENSLLSVSVIDDDCATADAYATAFMVMGVHESITFAEKNNMEVFLIYDDNGELKTSYSKNFGKYIVAEN